VLKLKVKTRLQRGFLEGHMAEVLLKRLEQKSFVKISTSEKVRFLSNPESTGTKLIVKETT